MTVLGILEHDAVLESLYDRFEDELYVAKYVDDLTILERVEKGISVEEESDGNNIRHTFKPLKSQNALEKIIEQLTLKSMKINASKT